MTRCRQSICKTNPERYGIVVASCCCHCFVYGISWTVGVFFVMFLDAFQAKKGVTAWAGSLNTACCYAVGPISSMLTNKFGCRPTVILGGVISAIGLGTSAFATNIYHLYITFGIVTGIGFGFVYIPSVSIIAPYFKKKRALAYGVATAGIGIGSMVYPPIIDALNNQYGWRGTLLILSGITLNICVAGAFMKPFKSTIDDARGKVKERLFNVGIFRSVDFLILCMNNMLFCFGVSVVYTHLAEYALQMDIGGRESSILFSVIGISNFLGRFVFGFIGNHPLSNDILVYLFGFLIPGIATLLVPLLTQFESLLIYATIFGTFTSVFGVQLASIVCQIIGEDQLATGFGVLLPFEAFGTMLGGPVAGFMYDGFESTGSFFVGGGALVLSATIMIVPYLREKRLHARALNDNTRIKNNLTEVMVKTENEDTVHEDHISNTTLSDNTEENEKAIMLEEIHT
ncbi:unnamed protein product [Owenia fusiformis]|uniref:Uncharacterized protein n=1 Tax=Owenia fusiformis TaxID=6347 RepID=A0A8J1T495_OWEFU|nr:unnamed protein product [Owenia fusiformis]